MKTFFTNNRVQLLSIVVSSIAVLISAISIFLTIQIIKHQQVKDSADLVLTFDKTLDNPQFIPIEDSLDSNDSTTKILKSNGGIFSDRDVENYLSQYETLDIFYQENLIDHEMVNQVFSWDLENAYQNKEIQKFVKDQRKISPELWTGFIHLGEEFK